MKYIVGALIISFAVLLLAIFALVTMRLEVSETLVQYFWAAWAGLAIVAYPVARKIMR